MRRAWLVLTACGRVGFDPQDGLPAEAGTDATATDAPAPDAPAPDAPAAFGSITIAPGLAAPSSQSGISLTSDMLEIYFESTQREMQGDVFMSTRATLADAWGPPSLVAELSTLNSVDGSTSVSGDGLTILFISNRPGSAATDIYVSTRIDRASAWAVPMRVAAISSTSAEIGIAVAASNLELVFESDRPGSAGYDLYLSTRATTGDVWGAPSKIVELSTSQTDLSAWFAAGDHDLVFARGPAGAPTDLFIASRPAVGAPFGPSTPLAELNTVFQDNHPWLSPDGRTIFFASDRSGNDEIYFATR